VEQPRFPEVCEDDVVALLLQVHSRAGTRDEDPEAALDAVQNAEVVAGAELYYRTMVRGNRDSWNVRDVHMADTLDRLTRAHGPHPKAIVWAHNSHIGDARGTSMTAAGMVNIGQLVRQRHDHDGVVLVGFGGHRGDVIAADYWGGPIRRLPVPPALPDSHEDVLHDVLATPSLLVFPEGRTSGWLTAQLGHRAIGVVYDPTAERAANWVPTTMGDRYDAFCFFEETEALHPLHGERPQLSSEMETFPTGR
jgi:erythromycin esterase-like protein